MAKTRRKRRTEIPEKKGKVRNYLANSADNEEDDSDEIVLNEDQAKALYLIETWYNKWTTNKPRQKQTFELAGGPGTGKTTLIRYAIKHLGIRMRNVAFLAYMGKAAMQMARNGLPAQTIHSFMYELVTEWKKDEDGHIMVDTKGKPIMKKAFRLKKEIPSNIELLVVDEGSLVSERMGEDLKSFNLPIIVLGDLNQLPPVFGRALFLYQPDYTLTKIMRQEENNPIIWLSRQALTGQKIPFGKYGGSLVIPNHDLTLQHLKKADMIITNSNRMRQLINYTYRTDILKIARLDIPQVGERVICRKNNWKKSICDKIFLTNGMTGTIDFFDISTLKGNKVTMDFKPDFLKKKYKNLSVDYRRFYESPGNNDSIQDATRMFSDQFEFAYAITTYLSQGSQWDNVLYIDDDDNKNPITRAKERYVAISRAIKNVTIVT